MKKLIAILSSMMMITTASLPIIACHTKQKETKFENNNSITNAQTTASLFAKELILADQLKVNLEEIKKEYNNKSLTDLLKDNNLKLDNTDSSISDVKTLNDLVDKYFEKDSYKSGLDLKIKLDSEAKKTSIPLFSEIFKLIGLGTNDLDKYSDDILKILELTTSLNPAFLVTGFDSVNSTLKSSFEKIKPYLKEGLEKLSNPSSDLTKYVQAFQDKIDVNAKYKELKAEDLDNAFYLSLVNAIGLSSVGTKYTPIELKSGQASKSLKQASQALAKALNGPAAPTTGQELNVVAYILQSLQFLQLKLSLFEEARDHSPKTYTNLFSDSKKNEEFIKTVYNGKTLKEIAKDKQSSINLKYIFSFMKKAVDELKDETKKDGFELQKLLGILFLVPNKVEYYEDSSKDDSKEYYENNKAHPALTILADIAKETLNKKLKPLVKLLSKETKDEEIKKVVDTLIEQLYKWTSFTLNSLLTGTKNLNECLSALFGKALPVIIESIQKNTKLIPESLKEKIGLLPLLLIPLIDKVLAIAFPILMSNKENTDSFKDLYGGEVFLVNKVNDMFKEFRKTIGELAGQESKNIPFSTIRNYLTVLENGYDKIFKNVREFNLKGLLTTPLNKMNETWWKDQPISKSLQEKSVADVLDSLLNDLDVKGNEKLDQVKSSNINLTSLAEVAKVMDNYTYKTKDINANGKTHLLEILKNNPDKTLEILGWTSDKNNPIGKDSLIYTLLTKVFNVDLDKKDDKSQNAINQISKIISIVNKSIEIKTNLNSVEIKFEFKDAKKNKSDQLLSETLVAKVKNRNDKSESTYSFSYLRDKQDKFKFTKITKN
ncbi:MOLPALP family lipoprotein [Mycoplasma feriruminatoris]|uniref:MOLPALP family lipoprotein n=1 Tax=Mycoplasma feriruminatoris TaxID=1179777 RepID=A0AAQ3DLK8_9MOLU|nr:MOLPALP family lipoprotein [Mycoplasma feriruminatoris]WFQ95064.1 MOLPALP family lipoprotein [Mycoplasma feriruminatoris]